MHNMVSKYTLISLNMDRLENKNRRLKTATFILTIIERDDGKKKQTLENSATE